MSRSEAPASQAERDETSAPSTAARGRRRNLLLPIMQGVRLATGIGAVVVLLLLYIDTRSLIAEISRAPINASAIQVTQVYAERIFYAVVTIGIQMSIYIGTRVAYES